MSTRANIIIQNGEEKLWFYRHSDGYPEGTLPTLEKFLCYVKDGRIRNNVGQAAGWLVILGAQEYNYDKPWKDEKKAPASDLKFDDYQPGHDIGTDGWKVGAYEPTAWGQHGDIQYLYTVDLAKLTIEVKEV